MKTAEQKAGWLESIRDHFDRKFKGDEKAMLIELRGAIRGSNLIDNYQLSRMLVIYCLDHLLNQFQVRHLAIPIRFEIVESSAQGSVLDLQFNILAFVLNRDGGGPIQVAARHGAWHLLRLCADHGMEEFADDLYRKVIDLLFHEIAECCYWKGERKWDPHKQEELV